MIGTGLTSDWSGENFRTLLVLQGAGHILTFLPVIAVAIANGDPKRAVAVAAYIQVIRVLGTQTAQALMTTFIRKGEQIHSWPELATRNGHLGGCDLGHRTSCGKLGAEPRPEPGHSRDCPTCPKASEHSRLHRCVLADILLCDGRALPSRFRHESTERSPIGMTESLIISPKSRMRLGMLILHNR